MGSRAAVSFPASDSPLHKKPPNNDLKVLFFFPGGQKKSGIPPSVFFFYSEYIPLPRPKKGSQYVKSWVFGALTNGRRGAEKEEPKYLEEDPSAFSTRPFCRPLLSLVANLRWSPRVEDDDSRTPCDINGAPHTINSRKKNPESIARRKIQYKPGVANLEQQHTPRLPGFSTVSFLPFPPSRPCTKFL